MSKHNSKLPRAEESVSVELLRELLHLDVETGKLYWRERAARHFDCSSRPPEVMAASWNARYAGKEAFTYLSDNGYLMGAIFGRSFRAHRVVFAMAYGRWPDGYIDHYSGHRTDNRPSKLRDVSYAENNRNVAIHSNNKSGYNGVWWSRQKSRWIAEILVSGKKVHIGSFVNVEDAAAARKSADAMHGFHANHGRTAALRDSP